MRPMALALIIGLVAACSSDVVRPPDCIDCRPVEMTMDQEFEIELGTDRTLGGSPDAYEWVVADSGSMTLVSEEDGTRSEPPDEFAAGYSRYTVFRLAPTEPGSTDVVFDYVLVDGGEADPLSTLTIQVDVTE